MSCHHPIKAYWTGNYTPNGKKELLLDMNSNSELFPIEEAEYRGFKIKNGASIHVLNGQTYLCDPIHVPCNYCLGCRIDRAKEWTYRCLAESKYHKFCYFVTLTYLDAFLPFIRGHGVCLSKRDLTLFLKALRNTGLKFRYFACGEYGSSSNRPHFHLIIFTDSKLELKQIGLNAFKSSLLENCWSKGIVSVSIADGGCIAYTAGYMQKKTKIDNSKYLVKPYIVMSRRPAIGNAYFNDHVSSIKSTTKIYLNGQTVKVPKIFWKYLDEDPDLESIKDHLKSIGLAMSDKLKWFCDTPWLSDVGQYLDVEKSRFIKRMEKI